MESTERMIPMCLSKEDQETRDKKCLKVMSLMYSVIREHDMYAELGAPIISEQYTNRFEKIMGLIRELYPIEALQNERT